MYTNGSHTLKIEQGKRPDAPDVKLIKSIQKLFSLVPIQSLGMSHKSKKMSGKSKPKPNSSDVTVTSEDDENTSNNTSNDACDISSSDHSAPADVKKKKIKNLFLFIERL